MKSTSRALLVLCLSSLSAGCLAPQSLGDPEGTDGGDGTSGGSESDSSGSASGDGVSGSEKSTGTKPDECLPQGSVCPDPTGLSECCGAATCSADTGLCEAQGTKGGGVCGDFTPPPLDCPAPGDTQVFLSSEEPLTYAESRPCQVDSLDPDGRERWTVSLLCDDELLEFTYVSWAPYIWPPVEIGAPVLYTAVDLEGVPGVDASVTLRAPDGRLLFAFIEHLDLAEALSVDIAPLELSFAATGCGAFDAGPVSCAEEGESIAAARVSVEVGPGELASVTDGNSETFVLEDAQYRVSVAEATRLVCQDESCVLEELVPPDRLRMLIVAEPL